MTPVEIFLYPPWRVPLFGKSTDPNEKVHIIDFAPDRPATPHLLPLIHNSHQHQRLTFKELKRRYCNHNRAACESALIEGMSAFAADPIEGDADGRRFTTGHARESYTGQRHDRIQAIEDGEMAFGDLGDDGGRDFEISATQRMLSAVSGSFLTSVLVTPLDVVRVRLQSQPAQSIIRNLSPLAASQSIPTFANLPSNLGVTACCREVFWVNNNTQFCVAAGPSPVMASAASAIAPECVAEETQRRTFTSTFDGLRKIARHEGLSTLWRGLSPTLVMAVPANVIYFTGYDSLRYSSRSPVKKYIPDMYAPLVAGSVARIGAATVISPIEMFRTRLQASTHNPQTSNGGAKPVGVFVTTLRGLRDMVHAQGYSSLWRGLTLTLWRDVPFSGLYWWGYESIRNSLAEMRTKDNLTTRSRSPTRDQSASSRPRSRSRSRDRQNSTTTFTDSFIAGGLSGTVAAIVTTPFDVGKTRQQVVQHNINASGSGAYALTPEERSMPRLLLQIYKTEGIAGLWSGWAARCLKVAPACAIMISSYEIGKVMARGMNERREDRREGRERNRGGVE